MKETIIQFLKALELAGITLEERSIDIKDLGCPHTPNELPKGKMAIYTFQFQGRYLKIGKAGPKSNARFRSHHYGPHRANSSLARCLLSDSDMKPYHLDYNNVGNWIRQNTHRIDILLDQSEDIFVLNFLESFLQCKYRPKYEGFESQAQKKLMEA